MAKRGASVAAGSGPVFLQFNDLACETVGGKVSPAKSTPGLSIQRLPKSMKVIAKTTINRCQTVAMKDHSSADLPTEHIRLILVRVKPT